MVSCVHAESATGERVPQKTLVGPLEAIDVRLDPSVTGSQDYAICSVLLYCNLQKRNGSQVGLQGCRGSASRNRCRNTAFPPVTLLRC